MLWMIWHGITQMIRLFSKTHSLIKWVIFWISKFKFFTLGMIHIWHPWKLSNFEDPQPPLSIYVQNSYTPLTLDINFKQTPSLQMITNQIRENIIQGWLLYVIRSFLQVRYHFQYQLINLVCLSFDFFPFSWSLIVCFFMALYSCVCGCPKISQNVFYL